MEGTSPGRLHSPALLLSCCAVRIYPLGLMGLGMFFQSLRGPSEPTVAPAGSPHLLVPPAASCPGVWSPAAGAGPLGHKVLPPGAQRVIPQDTKQGQGMARWVLSSRLYSHQTLFIPLPLCCHLCSRMQPLRFPLGDFLPQSSITTSVLLI